jgi:very-short-patch-repair endonuclease
LRKSSTEAERVLWFNLRSRRLGGYKFRRQYKVGPFIVDFVCLEKKLIIEVDGGQHAEMIIEDVKRTEFLHRHGYTILRFWNNEVFKETESVLQMILSQLTEAEPPHPNPLPQGGEGIK